MADYKLKPVEDDYKKQGWALSNIVDNAEEGLRWYGIKTWSDPTTVQESVRVVASQFAYREELDVKERNCSS